MSRLSIPSADGQQAHAEREPGWMGEARKEDREGNNTKTEKEKDNEEEEENEIAKQTETKKEKV